MTGAIAFLFVIAVLFAAPEEVKAAPLDNAYEFYQMYGKQISFVPLENADGNIYYVSRGKSSTSSIRYALLGWQVSILDSKGKVLDKIYYVRGGKNMVQVDKRTVNGYVYTLYKVTWSNLKSRMSDKARAALDQADCNIIFDACMTVKDDGEHLGGMDESGPTWGQVYTTYNGIVNAQNWTSASKAALHSYYGKEVLGLFHTVTLIKTDGIKTVSGSGRYCYGTKVTISAQTNEGYAFFLWAGAKQTEKQSFTYVMDLKDVTFTAYAKILQVKVNFFWGDEEDGKPTETKWYEYLKTGQKFYDFGWKEEGFHQIGWSKTPNSEKADYTITSGISPSWLEKNYPEVDLYAVWAPNQYHIQYNANGGEGNITGKTLGYKDELQLPIDGFARTGHNLGGWGLEEDEKEFDLGEVLQMEDIVKAKGLEYRHDVTIQIYAIWGSGPKIKGTDAYISLKDAQKGKVTIRWLSKYVSALDEEDGEIVYGQHTSNSLLLTGYQAGDYIRLKKGAAITENFQAVDSDGNVTNKMITVHIVDSSIYDDELYDGTPRFISKEYYKDSQGNYISEEDGGLSEISVWRYLPEYREWLDAFFENMTE